MNTQRVQDAAIPPRPVAASKGFPVRLRGALIGLPLLAVLATACALTPRPSGSGTHEELGMAQCSFMVRFGYPCPTCGMTTAFAAMAHGQFAAALRAQAFGAAMFVATVFFAAVGMLELLAGANVIGRLPLRLWWLWIGIAGTFVGWGVKVWIGLADGTYPLR